MYFFILKTSTQMDTTQKLPQFSIKKATKMHLRKCINLMYLHRVASTIFAMADWRWPGIRNRRRRPL